MVSLFTSISRFTMLFWLAVFTYDSFAALRYSGSKKKESFRFRRQTAYLFLILLNGDAVIFLNTLDTRIIVILLIEIIFFTMMILIFRNAYTNCSDVLVDNMAMLLCIGFLMLTRLSIDRAIKQLTFATIGIILTALIPLIIKKVKIFDKLSILYFALSIAFLGVVLVKGKTVYGAKLNISIGGITFQPSEFVKILFVFFIASMLYSSINTSRVILTSVLCFIDIGILILSRDLGSAGIFLIIFLIMLYAATRDFRYLLGGVGISFIGAVLSYVLFSHVRVRVSAWLDPLSNIKTSGYQVSQSLFAIASGSWFGTGLCQGMPGKIPLSQSDFIFASITEEFGALFSLCLILLCVGNLMLTLNISLRISNEFYRLIALGLGTCYGAQVFIMIGGVIKFIPSTGVTLPLVSYGGSSLISTMLLFAIIQGLFAIESDTAGERK